MHTVLMGGSLMAAVMEVDLFSVCFHLLCYSLVLLYFAMCSSVGLAKEKDGRVEKESVRIN